MGVKYKREPFKLFSLEEYTEFLAEFIPLLRPDMVLQRLFGLSDYDLLIAPNWGLKKTEIQDYIDKGLQSRGVVQGSKYQPGLVV
jgi:radical SAM superfamily enzyme